MAKDGANAPAARAIVTTAVETAAADKGPVQAVRGALLAAAAGAAVAKAAALRWIECSPPRDALSTGKTAAPRAPEAAFQVGGQGQGRSQSAGVGQDHPHPSPRAQSFHPG